MGYPKSSPSDNSFTQHTLPHVDCPGCGVMGLKLTAVDADFSALSFREAAPLWKEIRKQRERLRPLTHETTRGYLAALEKFFGDLRLDKIHAGHLREYQLARQRNRVVIAGCELNPWRKPAGSSLINHELVALQQMLKHARLWAPLAPYYFPLPIPSWSPRAEKIEETDENRIFEAVKKHPEVALATWVATITNNTTAAGCELQFLRLRHVVLREPAIRHGVDLTPSEFYVPPEGTKNGDRPRRIPLNTAAKLAFMQCIRRAHRLGSTDPEHYLFPYRRRDRTYNPERPASRWWLRSNWNKLRKAAKMPKLQPHDLRHLAITRMCENPAISEQTVTAVAGHVGRKMMEYYSHIRMDAKLHAVMAIDSGRRKKTPQSVRVIQFPAGRSEPR